MKMGPPPKCGRTDHMFRAEEPQCLNTPKKAAVDRVPRMVVVHTMGTIKREDATHGDLRAPDLFQWESMRQNHLDESPSKSPSVLHKSPRRRGPPAGGRLPSLSSPQVHAPISNIYVPLKRHASISKQAPLSVRGPRPPRLPASMPMPTDAGIFDSKIAMFSPREGQTNYGRSQLLKSEVVEAWIEKGRVVDDVGRLQPLQDPSASRFNLLSCDDRMLPRHEAMAHQP